MLGKNIVWLMIILAGMASCKKYEDTPGPTDPRLSRPYCNDPRAVNYNWGFPGTPDNSKCFYPSDVFAGTYLYTDSVYDGSSVLRLVNTYHITFTKVTDSSLTLAGLCPTGTLSFRANRTLRADADSTVPNGQLLCRPQDTVAGNIIRPSMDSTFLNFNLSVISDTGVYYHRGSAVKQ